MVAGLASLRWFITPVHCNLNVVVPRPSLNSARDKHSPHRAVRPRSYRRQVLVTLRYLPDGFVELLPVKARSSGHLHKLYKHKWLNAKRKWGESGNKRGKKGRWDGGWGRVAPAAAAAAATTAEALDSHLSPLPLFSHTHSRQVDMFSSETVSQAFIYYCYNF